jgi:cyclophilin family peptidyl-prolyl cis-trans isomerase
MNDKSGFKILSELSYLTLSLIGILLIGACEPESDDPIWNGKPSDQNRLLIEEYPEVFQGLIRRDGAVLLERMNDLNSETQQYAWNALFHSELAVDLDILNMIRDLDHPDAWMMIGFQESAREYLDAISGWWQEDEQIRSNICRALGEIGHVQTLEIFLNTSESLISDPECALAAGRIMSYHNISERLKAEVASLIFESDVSDIQLRLLYGFYRNENNRPETGSPAYRLIREGWINTGPETNPLLDQYAVRILGREAIDFVILNRGNDLRDYPDLSIELARAFSTIEWTPEEILLLFETGQPHVFNVLIESLMVQESLPDRILNYVREVLNNGEFDDDLIVNGVSLLQHYNWNIMGYLERIDQSAEKNPYLTGQVLGIYKLLESTESYLNRIDSVIGEGNIRAFQAMQALADFSENDEKANPLNDRINEIFWKGIHSGYIPVIQAGIPMMSNPSYLRDENLDRLEKIAHQYSVDNNSRFHTDLAEVLTERFGEEAETFVMNIAAAGYKSLNNKLRKLGWEIPDHYDQKPAPFREPDWDKLYEMGENPHWILETSAGRIEVALDPLSAPATVSSIDSLTRAGAYNQIYFHRVVPNFVIQSGDVGGGTGIGGPGYLLPIEPSIKSFDRGIAGIASLGPDTEGSQFFFMNQWSPHLDGRYTIFGHVVSGMDVVDKIRVGDRIENAYIKVQSVEK